MRLAAPVRRGLSLIEVLVVIAIIAVLVGLLIPAVAKVRDMGHRTTCANNLHQIGIACLAYYNDNGVFPPGGDGSPFGPARADYSFSYYILPYIEQGNAYLAGNAALETSPVTIYYCPARRSPGLYGGSASLDYAGNAGTDEYAGSNGVIVRTGATMPVTLAMISDGAANTIMVGEKQLNTAELGKAGDDRTSYVRCGWAGDFAAYRIAVPHGNSWLGPARDFNSPGNTGPSMRFGSSHWAGANFVFADGAVHFVSYGANPASFMRACVRDDGQPLDLGELF
jgi:prepilin-type N-terminal cleavage/methylation domain-containing protein